jgi:hypothetical protein
VTLLDSQSLLRQVPGFRSRVPAHDRKGECHLGHGQDRRRGQVELLGRLAIDLDLDRGKARPSQDHDHPKAGKAKGKNQQGRRGDRRRELWQGHFAPRLPAVGTQRPGRFLDPGVQGAPYTADHAQHDAIVVEHVREQDDPDSVLHVEGGRGQAQQAHQRGVQQAVGTQEGQEGRCYDQGGHNERDGGKRLEQRPAPKAVAAKDVRPGQAQSQCEESGGGRLPRGEPQQPCQVAEAGHGRQVLGPQTADQDGRDRIKKEDREKQERQGKEGITPCRHDAPDAAQERSHLGARGSGLEMNATLSWHRITMPACLWRMERHRLQGASPVRCCHTGAYRAIPGVRWPRGTGWPVAAPLASSRPDRWS